MSLEKTRKTRCKSHCRTCGGCFSSDSAFDAHRRGPMSARYCVDMADDPRFAVKSSDGGCCVRGDVWGGVRVWTLARNMQHRSPWSEAA